jgi:hypothetical protein
MHVEKMEPNAHSCIQCTVNPTTNEVYFDFSRSQLHVKQAYV